MFDTEQGINAIKDQMTSLLSVDRDGNPINNSYWKDTIHYMVYIYNDSLVMKVYKDGGFISSELFSYPHFHEDIWIEYNTVITRPTVVVTINAGDPRFRFNIFSNLSDIIRGASHVWEER